MLHKVFTTEGKSNAMLLIIRERRNCPSLSSVVFGLSCRRNWLSKLDLEAEIHVHYCLTSLIVHLETRTVGTSDRRLMECTPTTWKSTNHKHQLHNMSKLLNILPYLFSLNDELVKVALGSAVKPYCTTRVKLRETHLSRSVTVKRL